jgi:flagellar hook-associated protein 2
MAVTSLLSTSQIQSLIQQASAAYQLPAATLQTQEAPMKAQISALGRIQGALSGLQSALGKLADVESLSQRFVATSPASIVTATVTNAAPVGTYSLANVHLAKAESLISSGSTSSSGSLGSGSISIKVGSGTAVTINITSGSSSLSGIAAAIDQANTGVTASVLFDGSKYRLVLTGNGTGAVNAFTVSGTGGLAGLSYHAGAYNLTESQAAADAGFTLNGIAITNPSNTISNAIPGVTLNLASSGSATVTVNQNSDALSSAAQGVVQALNQALSTINQQTAFSVANGGGPLLGNVGVEQLRQTLLNALTAQLGVGSAANGSSFSSLSSVGFQITSGGTITLDAQKFQSAAQSNYAAVASLLGAIGVPSNANVNVTSVGAATPGSYAVNITSNANGTIVGTVNGLAASGTNGELVVTAPGSLFGMTLQVQPGVTGNLGTVTVSQGLFGSLSSVVDAALASGSGGIVGQITGLNTSIAAMDKQIAQLQQQAALQTQLLTKQFTAAQATLNQLTTVSSFLTAYFKQTSG